VEVSHHHSDPPKAGVGPSITEYDRRLHEPLGRMDGAGPSRFECYLGSRSAGLRSWRVISYFLIYTAIGLRSSFDTLAWRSASAKRRIETALNSNSSPGIRWQDGMDGEHSRMWEQMHNWLGTGALVITMLGFEARLLYIGGG
jgi:hypothetical protein